MDRIISFISFVNERRTKIILDKAHKSNSTDEEFLIKLREADKAFKMKDFSKCNKILKDISCKTQ